MAPSENTWLTSYLWRLAGLDTLGPENESWSMARVCGAASPDAGAAAGSSAGRLD